MKKYFSLIVAVLAVMVLALFFQHESTVPALDAAMVLRVDSSMFHDGLPLQTAQTCDGVGARPPLTIADVPEDTRTFAVHVEDADAPSGASTHWLAWNIPVGIESIRADELPSATVEGVNNAGTVGWIAPCPSEGETHRYIFTIFALDASLALTSGEDYVAFARAAEGHVIGKGTITGTHKR